MLSLRYRFSLFHLCNGHKRSSKSPPKLFQAFSDLAPHRVNSSAFTPLFTRSLRSSSQLLLSVRLHLSGLKVPVPAPQLWKRLPFHLKSCPATDINVNRSKEIHVRLAVHQITCFIVHSTCIGCEALWVSSCCF